MASDETRKSETLADIVVDLRSNARHQRNWACDNPEYADRLDRLADRIEAAWKREREELAHRETQSTVHKRICEPQTVGNAAAMREALELLNQLFDSCVLGTHSEMTADEMDKVDELYFKTKAALAAAPAVECPPSNVAALRDALTPWVSLAEWLIENAGKEALGRGIAEIVPTLRKRIDESKSALATTEGGAA